MPVDYGNFVEKIYEINYNELLNDFKNFSFFKNKRKNNAYLKKWFNYLKKYDNQIKHQIFNKKRKNIISNLNLLKDEIFQKEIIFDYNKIFIHFKIDILIEKINILIEKKLKMWSYLDLEFFKNNESNINWSPVLVETIDKNFSKNNNPVYLIQFLSGIHEWLLIDGNYRVSSALLLEEKMIKAIFITEKELLEINPFINNFDKYFYIFFNEIYFLQISRINFDISEKEALKKSFLTNKKFNF